MSNYQSSRSGGWGQHRPRGSYERQQERHRSNHHNDHQRRGGWHRNSFYRQEYHSRYSRNDNNYVPSQNYRNDRRNSGDERGYDLPPASKRSKGMEPVSAAYPEIESGPRPSFDEKDIFSTKQVQQDLTPEQQKCKDILISQYRYPDHIHDIPSYAFKLDTPDWFQKKQKAAEHALAAVQKQFELNEQDDEKYDSESDVEVYGSFDDQPQEKTTKSFVDESMKSFFAAITECYPFTTGFDVTVYFENDDKHCYCPCGPFMQNWRANNDLVKVVEGNNRDCKENRTHPIGLMAHLKSIGGVYSEKNDKTRLIETRPMRCPLHYGLRVYLEHLYSKSEGDYRGGVGHKAMYCVGDKQWKRADAAEKMELKKQIELGNKVIAEQDEQLRLLEETNKKHEDEMAKLKKISKDQYEKIMEFEKERKALGIKKKETVADLTIDQLKVFRRMIDRFFNSAKGMLHSERTVESTKKQTKRFEKLDVIVNQRFDNGTMCNIQELFDSTFYGTKSNQFRIALFEDRVYPEHILWDWKVQIRNNTFKGKHKKDFWAEDEGGVSRQFLSECWKQLGGLKFLVGTIHVRLFEDKCKGIVPVTDEKLRSNVKIALKEQSGCSDEAEIDQYLDVAKKYYRAIGRLILHSIACNITISSSSMIPLYQNYLLRGCSPADAEYHRDDILKHIDGIIFENAGNTLSVMIGLDWEFSDGTSEVLDKDTIFTKLVPDQCINSRKISLDSMKEGLSLRSYGEQKEKSQVSDEIIFLPDIFCVMPLDGVEKLLFSQPSLTVEDVINVLHPAYDKGAEHWEGSDESRLELKKQQEIFFQQMFVPFLIEKSKNEEQADESPSFLSKFVECCTGLNYLPYLDGKSEKKITVEFNYEAPEPGGLPKFWTCENVIVLPGHLYSDYDHFSQQIEESINYSFGQFDMN